MHYAPLIFQSGWSLIALQCECDRIINMHLTRLWFGPVDDVSPTPLPCKMQLDYNLMLQPNESCN